MNESESVPSHDQFSCSIRLHFHMTTPFSVPENSTDPHRIPRYPSDRGYTIWPCPLKIAFNQYGQSFPSLNESH